MSPENHRLNDEPNSQNVSANAQDDTKSPQSDSERAQRLSEFPQDDSANSQDDSANSQDVSANSQDDSANSQDDSARSKNDFANSQSDSAKNERPRATLFASVALLSAAVLGYEVALSRVFAVLLRYQFAFLVISLAVCGLGLGGLLAAKWGGRRGFTLPNLGFGFAAWAVISLGLVLRGVFPISPENYWIAALLILVPFIVAGAFLSLVFERYQEWGGKLYGYDLAGAAVAAALCVAIMQGAGAIAACLFFAALGALAGAILSKKLAPALGVTALFFALWPLNSVAKIWEVQPIPPSRDAQGRSVADRGITQPLYAELRDPQMKTTIVDSRWNAFARTDVVKDELAAPGDFLLYTNGNVPTNMLPWDGKLWRLPAMVAQFPLSDWTFENADLRGKSVLSIGPGGGLDALLALRYGAKKFDGAEINPSIVALMDEPKYREFNGGIYCKPGVNVVTAEGRAFVREARARGEKYALIFSALTKTATAGQGAALLESFIYTTDAFDDYLAVLEDGGKVAIVGDAPPLLARLYATAIDHFQSEGKTTAQAGQHVAALFYPAPGPYQWALVVQKTPFTAGQAATMNSSARARNIFPLWIPGAASSNELYPFGSLGSGVLTLDGFIASGLKTSARQPMPLDLSPAPDDRPFVLDLAPSAFEIFKSSPSLSILLGLSVLGTLGFAGALLGARHRSETRVLPAPLTILYFGCLGVGFMLVEIPLIQKLVLPLGYPTLSLTVILFSVLLGGGAGALFSQRFEGEKLREHALKMALCAAIFGVGISVLLGAISDVLLAMPLVVRCVVAALFMLPLGFALGTPFPSGMRLFVESRSVPLVWALNGTASVVGSIGSVVLAKMLGFNSVVAVGAAIYLLVAWLLFRAKIQSE